MVDPVMPISGGTLNLTRPVGRFVFCDTQGQLEFSPLDDITPVELAWLLMLFTSAQIGGYGQLLWRDYVEAHGLLRHFKPATT